MPPETEPACKMKGSSLGALEGCPGRASSGHVGGWGFRFRVGSSESRGGVHAPRDRASLQRVGELGWSFEGVPRAPVGMWVGVQVQA